jgi:hypothetical protein
MCSVSGCTGRHLAKGLCSKHYYRSVRRGSLQTMRERGVLRCQRKCSVDGCDNRQVYAGPDKAGYCVKHNAKLTRSGTLERKVFGSEWASKQSEAHRSELTRLDPTPDVGVGRRGFLAANMVNEIRQKALKRGKRWLLDAVGAYRLITAPCAYCGRNAGWPADRNGIDRVDPSGDYTPSNCVPACFTCNSAKGRMTVAEFRAWVERVHGHAWTGPVSVADEDKSAAAGAGPC